MQWTVAVTTAPRPVPTLEATLAGLARAGWQDIEVIADTGRAGAWATWLKALGKSLARRPAPDALLLCQDDAAFCRGLRDYLERTLWPNPQAALCSPYCPAVYRGPQRGWHREDRGWQLIGAVCWAIPRAAAEAMFEALRRQKAEKHVDARVGRWAEQTRRSVWYHTPSLVQHIADANSTLGYAAQPDLRQAADFIGEDAAP